ncbi:cytochrome P450 [Acidisarcina polymorpha]|nr:cytochrome P450 [Acidisarcina polymorpha]
MKPFATLPGIPFFSTIIPLSRNALSFFMRTFDTHGDRVQLRVFSRNVLLLCNPDDIEAVLVNERDSFGRSSEVRNLRPILGNGLFASEGELWRSQRRLIQPKFHSSAIQSYASVMLECVSQRIEGWRPGDLRNLHLEMMHYTRDVVCRTLFGSKPDVDAMAIAQAVTTVFDDLRSEVLYLNLWRRLPLPRSICWNRAVKVLDQAISRMISHRRRARAGTGQSASSSDMLNVLLDARGEDGTSMSDRQIHDEIMNMFIAGHETSALTLAWAMHLLSTNPDIQDHAASEVLKVTSNRPLRPEDMPSLRYLSAIVQETLRLYPPLWCIGRYTIRNTTLSGFPVARGTHIWLCIYRLHRDPRWFSDPEAFQPERWQDGTSLKKFTYVPFGVGPRVCIGQHFAMVEIVLGLAAILSRFRLSSPPGSSVAPEAWMTLRPKHAVSLRIDARSR